MLRNDPECPLGWDAQQLAPLLHIPMHNSDPMDANCLALGRHLACISSSNFSYCEGCVCNKNNDTRVGVISILLMRNLRESKVTCLVDSQMTENKLVVTGGARGRRSGQ